MWLYPSTLNRHDNEFKDFCRFVIDSFANMLPDKKTEFVAFGLMKYAIQCNWREFADDAMRLSPLEEEAKLGIKDEFGSEPILLKQWGQEYLNYIN